MWPWQQKKLGKHSQTPEQLLWRVLQISVIGHLLVLLLFLFGGRSSVLHISMRAFPNNARIVCVPSFMLPSCKNKYAGRRGSASALRASDKVRSAVAQKTVEKTSLATVEQSRTAVQKKLSPRELRRERLRAHKLERENKRKQAREEAARKRIEEREAKQRVAEQREADLKRAAEQRVAQAKDTVSAPESTASVDTPEAEVVQAGVGEGDSDETVIYVDSATYQMTEMMKELQQALQQVWEQPAGCAVGYACEVSVTVSGDGKASAVAVRKKSGAAVYDMAARRAANAAVYPKLVYNRTIVIHFGE